MKKIAAVFSLLFIVSTAASAAVTAVPKLDKEGRKGDIARLVKEQAKEKFDAADMDKDGKLSREEVAKIAPYKAENFERFDLDTDGFLSWEEYLGHSRWEK
ncbi:MAG: hypothetical protein A2Z95_09555 [Gallionellales bacterium GWA2_60_18]|nr:MAG: hypothetical protein A2Z95_09555 [Gallionellales bacterium GWA2_60_18]